MINRTKILAVIIYLCLVAQPFHAQQLQMPDIAIGSRYIGPFQTPVAATKSIPPHYVYRIEGQDYQIKLRMNFPRNGMFPDSLYGIVCILPDGSSRKLHLNRDSIVEYSPKEYEYSFPLRIKDMGWVQIFLVSIQEFARDTDVRFYRDVSKKELIYLRPE